MIKYGNLSDFTEIFSDSGLDGEIPRLWKKTKAACVFATELWIWAESGHFLKRCPLFVYVGFKKAYLLRDRRCGRRGRGGGEDGGR